MRKIALFAVLAAVAATIGAGVAAAAAGLEHDPQSDGAGGGQEGVNLAEAPTARVAVWVDGEGTGSYTVKRGRGIAFVTNPADGTFCVRTNAPGLHPGRVIPTVAVEYSLSELNTAAAQWRSGRPFCPAGTIEVVTFDTSTGGANNTTSFTVTIP